MDIKLFVFCKRENSTAQPDLSGAGVFTGTPVDPFTALAPRIRFIMTPAEGIPTYNYAYISGFHRYYFIDNWEFSSGAWFADMRVDVLATYKTAIGDSTQYILRCASEKDGAIVDTMYPTKAGITQTTTTATNPWFTDYTHGFYVAGIINNDGGGMGAVTYYAFDRSSFATLMRYLLGDPTYTGVFDIPIESLKVQFNPLQYFASVMWFPVAIRLESGAIDLPVGYWNIPSVYANRIKGEVTQTTVQLSVPKHPQAGSRGQYLNLAPYASYLLDIRPFGQIPLDGAALQTTSTLYCKIDVDPISGGGVLTVSTTDNYNDVLAVVHARVGVPVQLSQMGYDYMGGALNAVGTGAGIGTALLTGNVAGVISSAASGIAGAVNSRIPQMSSTGSNGSLAEYQHPPTLSAQFYPIVDADNTHYGAPLCKDRVIKNLSGYIMVGNADIQITGISTENTEIKNLMERGFYYE